MRKKRHELIAIKSRRKCDKALPICGLCARMGRPCDYAETTTAAASNGPAPTAEDLAALQARLAELEGRLRPDTNSGGGGGGGGRPPVNSAGPLWLPASMNRFPSAIFLDIDCFKWAQLPIPKPNVDVPADVYEILSSGNAVQDATSEYFSNVHCWFPIVSRKRMLIGTSLWEAGPDLAMLFLAMLLVSCREFVGRECAARHPLYAASKRFLALLEAGGNVSLMHLQAMLLVAVYEFGHALYPAAWMTVAQCARYVDVLGLPSFKESSLMLGSCVSFFCLDRK